MELASSTETITWEGTEDDANADNAADAGGDNNDDDDMNVTTEDTVDSWVWDMGVCTMSAVTTTTVTDADGNVVSTEEGAPVDTVVDQQDCCDNGQTDACVVEDKCDDGSDPAEQMQVVLLSQITVAGGMTWAEINPVDDPVQADFE